MARRKRLLDDGDDSDSNASEQDYDFGGDPDTREERDLFENPYRKRRRTTGKDDATYGIFAEDSEDEGFGKGRKPTTSKRSDWAKAPAFVSGDKSVELDDPMQLSSDFGQKEVGSTSGEEDKINDSDGSEGEGEIPEAAEYSDESEPSRTPSPRVRMEDEEDEPETRPRLGGIGSRGGIGKPSSQHPSFAGAGIGSKPSNMVSPPDDGGPFRASPTPGPIPSAFASRSQSFMREVRPPPKPAALPVSEMAHFQRLQSTFGAKMLAKMGWKAGSGLGVEGEGIVTPVETKLRPQKMGIAFKGFKEKTEQSKLEARRRGEDVSDDEDEKTKRMKKKVKEAEKKRSDVWKRPKKVKTKVEHKTYEQILEEAGEGALAAGVGQIIDARGPVLQEVSLADISLNTWTPTNDPTRIPEVRHNVRLIADACKSDLDSLAREAKALQERKKFVISEDARLRKQVQDETELIARLQQIRIIANDIETMAKELSSLYEISLVPFNPHFQQLIHNYSTEYEKYRLDEIVVAAIAPVVRRMVATWNPLEDPTFLLPTLKNWRRALKINSGVPKPDKQIDTYGTTTNMVKPVDPELPMTPFESLLWNVWLPKVRTAINNEWSPEEPQLAITLYEAWSTFLPAFIRDNLLDQLILPKLQKTVADWNLKKAKVSLQVVVFPWLPHVGLRLEDVVGDARRKIKSLLRSWAAIESVPADLAAWREVFDAGDWDTMVLKYVVPKLGATLRNDFRVNPRDQKMEPLRCVLFWSRLIRPTIFSQILETEFFPKWLDVLHIWLIQPRVSFEEVAQWYAFWKEAFPEDVRNMAGISRGFTRGLQLMNKAIELGPDAPMKLVKPDFLAEIAAAASPSHGARDAAKAIRPSARTLEITFRSIVEEFAASHNLLFIPTGKAHELSRMPLYRVSKSADGKKGLLVYILDDAVWAPKVDRSFPEAEEFKAISLEDMVLRAS